MKRSITLFFSILIAASVSQAQVVVTSTDHFSTRDQMLLANEINESGEPFAEALGYDLDQLDPMVLNLPDSISYTLGIENYEYSRYLLGTVISRSGIGLHMMDKTLNPAAMGQSLMKQYLWAQDMLGGFHDGSDEGVTPDGTNSPDSTDSPHFDPDNNIYYGGSALDGFIDRDLPKGEFKTSWSVHELQEGIYYLRIMMGSDVVTKKVVIF